jgi:SagB-type dehydrogenase family enzyme
VTEPEPERLANLRAASLVYGVSGPAIDDLAETYHEASKLNDNWGIGAVFGAQLLEVSEELRRSAYERSTLRHARRPWVDLPDPVLPSLDLGHALTSRASCRAFADGSVMLGDLSAVLYGAYGLSSDRSDRRATPSGGGLYPLEVYVIAKRVEGLGDGLFHYDPLLHRLDVMYSSSDLFSQLRDSQIYPEIAESAPLMLAVSGVFWRSRFKYGLRGYRFCLLEAGHLMQTALLIAAAIGLGAVPIGGYIDNKIERVLGVDGVNESVIYMAAFGMPAA